MRNMAGEEVNMAGEEVHLQCHDEFVRAKAWSAPTTRMGMILILYFSSLYE
jgi:hypothetical protein